MFKRLFSGKILAYFPSLILIVTALVLVPDTFRNPQKIYEVIGVASGSLLLPFLVLQLVARCWTNSGLKPLVKLPLFIALIILWPLIIGLSIYSRDAHPNAVYSLTQLNLIQVTNLAFYLTFSWLINQPVKWWRKYWQIMLFALPFLAYLLLLMVSFWPLNFFKEIVKEDHIIEYLQFWTLILGGVSGLLAMIKHLKIGRHWRAMLAGLAMLVFFVIAGDEISWGQRLLGLETSESYQEINRQGELTWHNLYAVEWLMIYAYTSISLIGTVIGGLSLLSRKVAKMTLFAPGRLLIGFFVLSLIYFVGQLRVNWGIWHPWSEVAELSHYAGVVFWYLLFENQTNRWLTYFKKTS